MRDTDDFIKEDALMWHVNFPDEDFNTRDVTYGYVTGCGGNKLYLDLQNGQTAFAYHSALPRGAKVQCSIRKLATNDFRVLVSIDSVCNEFEWLAAA